MLCKEHEHLYHSSTHGERIKSVEHSCDGTQQRVDIVDGAFGGQGNLNAVEGPTHEINNYETKTDDTYTCDGCGEMIKSSPDTRWYRCATCVDIDVCIDCFYKDIHAHHKADLQIFKAPDDWNAPYCDACGFSFTDPDGILYQCTKCEDYCLCERCKFKLLHFHHCHYLKQVFVEQYLKYIV